MLKDKIIKQQILRGSVGLVEVRTEFENTSGWHIVQITELLFSTEQERPGKKPFFMRSFPNPVILSSVQTLCHRRCTITDILMQKSAVGTNTCSSATTLSFG